MKNDENTTDVGVVESRLEDSVSLLDVSNVSFDSFLASAVSLIPQFIFESINVMENGTTRQPPEIPDQQITNGSSLVSQVSKEFTAISGRESELSPSEEILELLCRIDVKNNEYSGINTADNDSMHDEVRSKKLKETTSPETTSFADSPDSMNTAFCFDSQEFHDMSVAHDSPTDTVNKISTAEQTSIASSAITQHPIRDLTQVVTAAFTHHPVHDLTRVTTAAFSQPPVHDLTRVTTAAFTQPPARDLTQVTTAAFTQPPVRDLTQMNVAAFTQNTTLTENSKLSLSSTPQQNISSCKPNSPSTSLFSEDSRNTEVFPSRRITHSSNQSQQNKNTNLMYPLLERTETSVYRMEYLLDTSGRPANRMGYVPDPARGLAKTMGHFPYPPGRLANKTDHFSDASVTSANKTDHFSDASVTSANKMDHFTDPSGRPVKIMENFPDSEVLLTPRQEIQSVTFVPRRERLPTRRVTPVCRQNVCQSPNNSEKLFGEEDCDYLKPTVNESGYCINPPKDLTVQPAVSQLMVAADEAPLSPTESVSSECEMGVKKKLRTNYSIKQVRILEKSFLNNPYPESEAIEKLANDLDLEIHKLRVWFQNKRARWRRRAKENNTRIHPIYQPALPVLLSSTPHQAPPMNSSTSHIKTPASEQTPLVTEQNPVKQQSEQMRQMLPRFETNSIQSPPASVPSFLLIPERKFTPNVQKSHNQSHMPHIPTAVRYNSKLLSSGVLSDFNCTPKVRADEQRNHVIVPRCDVPVGFPGSLQSAVPPSRTISAQQNMHPPNLYNILPRNLNSEPCDAKMTSPSDRNSLNYKVHDCPKNQLAYFAHNPNEFSRNPVIPPLPLMTGFQPYFPQMHSVLTPHGSRHLVPSFYRA